MAAAGRPDSWYASQPLARGSESRANGERLVSRPDATGEIDSALGPHRRRAAIGHLEVSPHPAGFVAPDQGGDPVAAGRRGAEHKRRRLTWTEAVRRIWRRPGRLDRGDVGPALHDGA